MSIDFNSDDDINIKNYLFDENEDGQLDSVLDYKRNAAGKIYEVSVDYNGDGVADSKIFFEYDKNGRIIKKSVDKNMSGVINSVVIYEYDSEGKVTVHYDDNADGKVDYIEKDGVVDDVRSTSQKITETVADIIKGAVNDSPVMPKFVKNIVNKEK